MLKICGHKIEETVYQSRTVSVLRAVHADEKRKVLLQIQKNSVSSKNSASLRREYDLLASHPFAGVPAVCSLDRHNDSLCMILENIPGNSLKELQRNSRLPVEQVLNIGIQLVDVLAEIHSANICYLNLSPRSILINSQTKKPSLIDFSFATSISEHPPESIHNNYSQEDLLYIAPEQTGRVTDTPDFRSDLYSLGIILYELLTCQHPFQTNDPLELVHAHIALPPVSPDNLVPDVPGPLGQVVMKLLAKAPVDRYQTCAGLRADLEFCRIQRRHGDEIEFHPGENDYRALFQFSETLFGRDQDLTSLDTLCKETRNKQARLVLVSGPSGIGKTTLVNQLQRPLNERGMVFLSGDFDQFLSNIPYAPLISAFQGLTRYILTRNRVDIEIWRSEIIEAVNPNGQVLIDVIPELELVIGRQPPVMQLPPAETENRFHLVLQRFIRACATKDHPLVLFLDNLHWSESSTLKLLELVLGDPSMANLLIIGCYRDDEINEAHILTKFTQKLHEKGLETSHIRLTPLEVIEICQFLATLLHCKPSMVKDLAEICHHKTTGNPFFLKQFLLSLVSGKQITFNTDQSAWNWNIDLIRQMEVTDNAATFIAHRITELSDDLQEVLQYGACLGTGFSDDDLTFICSMSAKDIKIATTEAVQKGFLVQEQQHSTDHDVRVVYKFSHHQVESAAYKLLSDLKRKQNHLKIGRLFLEKILTSQGGRHLFTIAEQLNKGSDLITDPEEQISLAEINRTAGKKAKSSAAYEPAHNYFQAGLSILPKEAWSSHYQLCLQLHVEGAEAAYLAGAFKITDTLFQNVLDNATTILDKVKIYEIVINAYKAENELAKAVRTGLKVLRMLGIKLPPNPSRISMLLILLSINMMLFGKKPEDLVNLPKMTEPHFKAVMSILESIGTAAYYTVPELLPMIGFKAVQLSLRYGNTDQSTIMGYPTYGFLQCGVLGNIDIGYRFGQVALDIQKHLHHGQTSPRTQYLVANLISHWKDHIADSIPVLQDASQRALVNGELEAAANSAYAVSYRLFFLGRNLTEVSNNICENMAMITKIGQQVPMTRLAIFQQAIDNLMHPGKDPVSLCGTYFNEEKTLTLHSKDRTTIFLIYHVKMILSYLLHQHDRALEYAILAKKHLESVVSSIFVPSFVFYDSLIKLAILEKSPVTNSKTMWAAIHTNLKKMEKWAHHAPDNYLHKYYLIQAEQEHLRGSETRALELFSKAAQNARESGYFQEEALAYERAASYVASQGLQHLGASFIKEAREGYERWGALAKVKQLDEKASQSINDNLSSELIIPEFDFSLDQGFQLDMMTVVKASRALAGEIILDEFLKKLMKIMIENAGAQKGFLLFEEDENWIVRVKGTIDDDKIEVYHETLQDDPHQISMTIVNYVARTSSKIVLKNAEKEGLFVHDRYIIEQKPKSVFCMPIIHQEKISCIVYLENNLNTGVFSPAREDLLHHLGMQAAISLNNSSLYSRLKDTLSKLYKEHVGMTFAICKMAESRDPETGEHLERMREYCRIIAMHLQKQKKYQKIITDDYVEHIYIASSLHDIGKIGVPDNILQKPDKLTSEEFEIMKKHTIIGQKSLMDVDRLYPGNDFISMGVEIAATHHEKWDGSGYPAGLRGEDIPLAGRILALGDVYDALTSKRVYKEAFSHEKSCKIIVQARDSHFAPDIVDAFNAREKEFEKIKLAFREN